MKNYRAVIRDTLKSVQSDIPYDIKMAFPESKPAGNLITFYEITNTGTELACVDVIAYQVDLWFMTLPDLLELTEKVDEALTSLGLIRQFASCYMTPAVICANHCVTAVGLIQEPID